MIGVKKEGHTNRISQGIFWDHFSLVFSVITWAMEWIVLL